MTKKASLVVLIISLILITGLFLYGVLGHYIYFASLMGVFFFPSLLLWYYIHIHADRWEKVTLTVVLTTSFLFSVIIEVVAVYLKFWTFFTDKDPLLGITIGDIPVEEFIFYFGANMQLCFLYLAVSLKCESLGITSKRIRMWFTKTDAANKTAVSKMKKTVIISSIITGILVSIGLVIKAQKEHSRFEIPEKYRNSRSMPVYKEGVWYPGWLIAIIPFFSIGIVWFFSVIKKINLAAFFSSLVINLTMYIMFEYNAIMRGHWVYNEQRLLGIRFAGTIPLEQILLYFVSFLFLVPFFESVRFFLVGKLGTDEEKKKYENDVDESISDIFNPQNIK